MTESPSSRPAIPSSASIRSAAAAVVATLRAQGFVAYFAGGCVRDEVMGRMPKDYDVATNARPERVRQIFRNTQAVGEHFGVILVREHGCIVEVATFRHESGYADRRRPDSVTFTDAENDARRRDFTINGLFMDPVSGEVIDFIGGQADIKAGIIRAIGDPVARLSEDHLRALRAVRFAARFGFEIHPATAEAVRRDAVELQGVSRERIGQEVRFMLLDAHRGRAVSLLHELRLDAPVLNESHCDALTHCVAAIDFPTNETAASVIAGSLAAWAVDRQAAPRDAVSRWRQALVLSNDERDGLKTVLRDLPRLQVEWGRLPVAGRKRLAAGEWFTTSLRVLAATDPRAYQLVELDVHALRMHAGGLSPEPLVTGDDLVAAGYEPGPGFKDALNRIYDEQLEGRLISREAGLTLAGRLLGR